MAATLGSPAWEQRLAAIEEYDVRAQQAEPTYDAIARIAAHVCAAPVALVTIIDAEYQWFKAHVGTDIGGTALDDAICAHALNEPDLLVIQDLSIDPRTAANRLVTDGPRVRFYAGVPLRVESGVTIGTLCVLDVAPRATGLDPIQRDTLQRLAQQVVLNLEMRRSLAQRDAALARIETTERQLSEEEQRWRHLFDNIADGFALADAIRDGAGTVVDWRYLDANRAWFAMVGLDRDATVGRMGSIVTPATPTTWIDELAQVIETGIPAAFEHHSSATGRWFRGRCVRIDGDRFCTVLHDITDERQAAIRQSAILRLGDALRECRSVADVTRAASAIVGETLNVARAGFGRIDASFEHVDVEPDWTREGVETIAGRHRFGAYGSIEDTLRGGDPLILHDVRTDPRTAPDSDPLLGQGIGALVNMPVRRGGRVTAIFFVHNSEPRHWTPEELGFLRKVADRVEVGVNQVEAEAQQALLIGELAHRLKNTLSMVQAIASQTLRGSLDKAGFDAFDARLQALAVAHDVLVDREWVGADMRSTVDRVIGVFDRDSRVRIVGPVVALGARAALALALILHELSTNAVKYGALSNDDGVVAVEWRVDETGVLTLEWTERGGPPVRQPTRRGFGSKLLRLGLAGIGDSDLCYNREGFSARMRANIADLAGG